MKNKKVYILVLIGIGIISNFSRAQTVDSIEENNLKFQTYFFEALKHKAIKNYSKAVESLEKCYEIDSLNTAVNFELSKNKLLLNYYFEADLFIDKALIKEPNNRYLLQHKIAVLSKQRNYKDAIEIQKKVVQIQPNQMGKLVFLYIQDGDFKNAEKLIIEVENKALSNQRIKGFKKYLEQRKRIAKTAISKVDISNNNTAIETLKSRFNRKKEYKLLLEILKRELENNLLEELFEDSKKGLEFFPAQPFLYKINGMALNRLGKYIEAIDVLTLGIDFVIDNNPMEADFYEQLSISYEGLKQKNKALKYKQKAKKLRKEN